MFSAFLFCIVHIKHMGVKILGQVLYIIYSISLMSNDDTLEKDPEMKSENNSAWGC